MMTRRQFVHSTTATAAGISLLQSCTFGSDDENYEKAINETWQKKMPLAATDVNLHRELIRYATLAPSSHNTQCWKFKIEDKAISILPDFLRRCPAVDPDDHHLFISIGCATENLVHAALAHGFHAEPIFNKTTDGEIKVSLDPTSAVLSPQFLSITERQSTRTEYDSKHLSAEELFTLQKAGTGKNIQLQLFTEKPMIEKILEYVIEANTTQIADPAFIKELKTWIRFNEDQAVLKGDGLLSIAAGNPALPSWLGNLIFELVFRPKSENEKYAKQIRSSAGIAVFTSDSNTKENWIELGRCYERFALQSTVLGIRNAFLNQPVEVLALQQQFATFLGLGKPRADLIVRFGRGPMMPRSVRRPIDAVII